MEIKVESLKVIVKPSDLRMLLTVIDEAEIEVAQLDYLNENIAHLGVEFVVVLQNKEGK